MQGVTGRSRSGSEAADGSDYRFHHHGTCDVPGQGDREDRVAEPDAEFSWIRCWQRRLCGWGFEQDQAVSFLALDTYTAK